MNFKKLQAMQAKLDEAILKEKAPMTEEERFNELGITPQGLEQAYYDKNKRG